MATLIIDDELYEECRDAAAQAGLPVEDLIADALRDWLGELQEDVQAARQEIAEYDRSGQGVDLEKILRENGPGYDA